MDKRKNKKISGQSLVELALVMPILVILLAGLAEIGWYAYSYNTVLEVSRQIARTATTLQNQESPLYWEDPDNGLLSGSLVEPSDSALRTTWLLKYRNCRVEDPSIKLGFYNLLGCIALQSMNPLNIDGFEPGKSLMEDIVISGFTVVPDGERMRVVKRYPSNASACDPNSRRETLGFTWGGNYINSEGCLGSEYTNAEVEQMMNLNNFGLTDPQRDYLQPQGVVLVEIHWQHTTLTQFVGLAPVISPVLAALGASSTISVWSAFPLPQVEHFDD